MMTNLDTILKEKWLTKRDRQIVTDLYYCKILNSDQIEKIYFKYDDFGRINKYSRLIALRRLNKLCKNDLLNKFWFSYNNRSSTQHFYLGPNGIELVSRELEIPKAELKWIPKGPQSFTFIENTIETLNIRVFFHKQNVSVKKFVVEQIGRIYYNNKYLEPDATIYCVLNNKERIFFIERDRGTMNSTYVKNKIKNYESCYFSQQWLEKFQEFPITLFVTTNEKRTKELLKIFKENLNSDLTFLFTDYEKAKLNITGKIWQSPLNNNLYNLK
ncbi:MAG: hypothetical protein JG780_6 [Thermosipho sp. (in: Bacteria)]|nr:hypothetical protein [Thermosipho sp. (in: thermotogales)]